MIKANKKVSIVIPVYNGSNFLSEAIESAMNQTYVNNEIIVVNDGSNDNGATEKIAKSYGDSITYYLKTNGGVASALNFGIQNMTGDYFSWLSHDDLYSKTKIEDQISFLNQMEEKENIIVACNSSTIYDNGLRRKTKIEKHIFDRHFDIFLSCSSMVGINGCGLLIPVTALKDAGGFNESLPVTQDYDLWKRLSKKNTFRLLDKQLVMYRDHAMQDSITKAELSLISGDALRAEILQSVSEIEFAAFMRESGSHSHWLWKNYDAYKQRGYIKTAYTILIQIALFVRAYKPDQINKFMKLRDVRDVSAGNDIDAFIEELTVMVSKVDESSYRTVKQDIKAKSTLSRYIDSAKTDGIGFLLRKALRKIARKLSRR